VIELLARVLHLRSAAWDIAVKAFVKMGRILRYATRREPANT